MSETARIRVVTVTYNPGSELVDFVTTLRAATTEPVELVIVDNGSEHDLVDGVVNSSGAELVRPGVNLGYGAGANLGARGGTEPWVVIANPDIRWEPDALDELLRAGERYPRAGALGPQIRNPDGSVYPSARAIPSLAQGAGHALFSRVWAGNPWTAAYHRQHEQVALVEHEVGWLSGSCLLLRREAASAVGGFDDTFFMFFEDVDLGDRLARAGWQNVFVPSAVVVHDQGKSWRERPASMIRAHHRSAEQYLRRRYGAWYQAPVRVAVSVGLRVRAALETRRRGGGPSPR